MAEQEQNRSEQATPYKLEEARKQGQVAKSLDFNSVVIIWALLIGLLSWGAGAWQQLLADCRALFAIAGAGRSGDLMRLGSPLLPAFMGIAVPVAAVGVVAGILGNLVQTGPVFAGAALKPKLERLNPVAGFKRIFNKRMLFEAFKSVLKLVILGWVTYSFLTGHAESLQTLQSADGNFLAAWLADNAVALLVRLGVAMLLIGLLDLLFARWQYRQQMMMSRRELKEETKRREGDPLLRAKLRELQRENLKQARAVSRVPDADVLITNPDHIAIALRYDRQTMRAPQVIAKGADAWAIEMKAMARRSNVPIYERRPLARKLLRSGEVDRAIPADCYVDVARLYADIEATKRRLIRYEVVS